MFDRRRCFVGASGRGNNWAFGYRQLAAEAGASGASGGAGARPQASGAWDWSTNVEDPGGAEFKILDRCALGRRKGGRRGTGCMGGGGRTGALCRARGGWGVLRGGVLWGVLVDI